ncbi:secondary active sulfate transmembrane transporter [Aureococcus anophagefferens]|nr:secondary active sulfate transmembrane transporter [Aureococcus anophagefferens]
MVRVKHNGNRCEGCGFWPEKPAYATCPRCDDRVLLCGKDCQVAWWKHHKSICEVRRAPAAPATGAADALGRLTLGEDALEACSSSWDPRRSPGWPRRAGPGAGSRGRRAAARTASRCLLAARGDGRGQFPRIVQPCGDGFEPKDFDLHLLARCRTFVTRRHRYRPRPEDYAHSKVLEDRASALARTHCQACGTKEMWRYRASLCRVRVRKAGRPWGVSEVPAPGREHLVFVPRVPRAYESSRRSEDFALAFSALDIRDDKPAAYQAMFRSLPFAPERRTRDGDSADDPIFGELRGIFGDISGDSGPCYSYGQDGWRLPPGTKGGDFVEETVYKGCGAAVRCNYCARYPDGLPGRRNARPSARDSGDEASEQVATTALTRAVTLVHIDFILKR